MKKLVIVGSGMSAMKVVDEVLKIDPLMYKITINALWLNSTLN
jgi:nitrite reductase (NADH) large subunit